MAILWPQYIVAQLSQLWSQSTGFTSPSVGGCVAVDNSDNVYVTGYVTGAFDGQLNAGNNDIVLQKYNSAGNKQWTRLRGTSGSDVSYGGE